MGLSPLLVALLKTALSTCTDVLPKPSERPESVFPEKPLSRSSVQAEELTSLTPWTEATLDYTNKCNQHRKMDIFFVFFETGSHYAF